MDIARFASRLGSLEKRLGVDFRDRSLLLEAVTHRSYLSEHPEHLGGHNERLEFLGDAILEAVVTEHLFRTFRDSTEGDLTKWRAALVNCTHLAAIAEPWRLDEALLLSKGEARSKDARARMIIRANAAEAIIGALFLDQGMGACRLLLDAHLLTTLSAAIKQSGDPKSELQEMAQQRFQIIPRYEVIAESGPDHRKHFEIAVILGGESVANGSGPSKRDAQFEAANAALATVSAWEPRVARQGGRSGSSSGKGA